MTPMLQVVMFVLWENSVPSCNEPLGCTSSAQGSPHCTHRSGEDCRNNGSVASLSDVIPLNLLKSGTAPDWARTIDRCGFAATTYRLQVPRGTLDENQFLG